MTIKVVCLSPWPVETVEDFFDRQGGIVVTSVPPDATHADVIAALRDADVVIGDKSHRHTIDAAALSVMPSCRLIHQPAVGFDTIDHQAAAALGIPVANSAGFNSDAVADWTVMAILTLVRNAALSDRTMHSAGWPNKELPPRELNALRIGIIGFGNAGARVARRLASFGARIAFTDTIKPTGAEMPFLLLDDLLRSSDVVSIHAALNSDTRGLMNFERISLMPRGSWLVNASRGPVVVERDLIRALESGHLAGAALDVFEHEPLADDSPLRKMDNVYLSPHIAGLSVEAEQRLIEMTAANLLRVLRGERPLNVVNGVVAN
jgi:D-3-phosphoglycerate dehydrogenase / 2-oxoglutarate reductase